MGPNEESHFGSFFDEASRQGYLSPEELLKIDEVKNEITSRFGGMKYILGLGLDFCMLAQELSKNDKRLRPFRSNYTESTLFADYSLVMARGNRQSNTLTLRLGTDSFGIRRLEEKVLDYFIAVGRNSYPSAYVYNTGQWAKYKELLVCIFSLSNFGRFTLFNILLEFATANLVVSTFNVVVANTTGPFEEVLINYPRSNAAENGGLVLQAITYAYSTENHGHLHVVASKVRTGSARQKRFGDVDCNLGAALAISFEVKDLTLTTTNYKTQIGAFIQNADQHSVRGIVVCADYDVALINTLNPTTTRLLSLLDCINIVRYWDLEKQKRAVGAMLHYLSNIEQNESATNRLSGFIDLL